MHCVFHAFQDYLQYLEIKPLKTDWLAYILWKKFVQLNYNQMTLGSITPWIIEKLANPYKLTLVVQTMYLDKASYIQMAHTERERRVIRSSNFGEFVDIITLAPAIYCWYGGSHAYFSTRVNEKHVIPLAIQLKKGK